MPLYPPSRVAAELSFSGSVQKGQKNAKVRRVQEWLCLRGLPLEIDGDFGDATDTQLKAFQAREGLPTNGVVDPAVFKALTVPLARASALQPAQGRSLSQLIADYAAQHVKEHPFEVGGPNAGPWVRAYMGWDGETALWCAGFTCTLLEQAAATLGVAQPIQSSASCDTLADRAKAVGKFVPNAKVVSGQVTVPPGSFFLVRATPKDWTHVGIVGAASPTSFVTYEGNTNNGGSRNGFEAISRVRNYAGKDFIVW